MTTEGGRLTRLVANVAILLAAAPALAQVATDGDTIRHDGVVYRLWGIDAPEVTDRCGDWPAGTVARDRLAELMAGRAVACEARDRDRWGRVVALCRAEGVDLSAAMVREGLAWAFTRYSRDYAALEIEARAAGRGVHGRGCVWRRG